MLIRIATQHIELGTSFFWMLESELKSLNSENAILADALKSFLDALKSTEISNGTTVYYIPLSSSSY